MCVGEGATVALHSALIDVRVVGSTAAASLHVWGELLHAMRCSWRGSVLVNVARARQHTIHARRRLCERSGNIDHDHTY
jgi:hypothetical protein